jgi:hypothetical protein
LLDSDGRFIYGANIEAPIPFRLEIFNCIVEKFAFHKGFLTGRDMAKLREWI